MKLGKLYLKNFLQQWIVRNLYQNKDIKNILYVDFALLTIQSIFKMTEDINNNPEKGKEATIAQFKIKFT